MVVNPVRVLLDRKGSEEHLQNSNESMKTKTKQNKNDKNKETITQSICQKNIEKRHDKEFGMTPAASHPIPPGSQLSRICTQRCSIYMQLRTLRVSGFSIGTVDAAWKSVLGSVQSTRL